MSDQRTKKGNGAPVPRPGYDVGYGKPPAHSRFKPGQSGNPKGRPKGARNRRPAPNEERLKDIIMDEAYREIVVRDGNRNGAIPMAQAIVRSMAVKAAKGDHRSQRLFAELLGSTESADILRHDEYLDTIVSYKAEWDEELLRRKRFGITDLPEPLPHPDHIRINMRTGTIQIVGPMTQEEKAKWDWLMNRREEFEEEREWLEQEVASAKSPGMKSFLMDDMKQTQKILDAIESAFGRFKVSGI